VSFSDFDDLDETPEMDPPSNCTLLADLSSPPPSDKPQYNLVSQWNSTLSITNAELQETLTGQFWSDNGKMRFQITQEGIEINWIINQDEVITYTVLGPSCSYDVADDIPLPSKLTWVYQQTITSDGTLCNNFQTHPDDQTVMTLCLTDEGKILIGQITLVDETGEASHLNIKFQNFRTGKQASSKFAVPPGCIASEDTEPASDISRMKRVKRSLMTDSLARRFQSPFKRSVLKNSQRKRR